MTNPGKNNNLTGKEIVWRIKYSLINSINLFSTDQSVELIPIIDRLLLLLQKNAGIELISSGKNEKTVFSFSRRLNKKTITDQWNTGKDKFLVGIFRLNKATDIKLYVYYVDSDDENISVLSREDQNLYKDLINLINNDYGDQQMSIFLRKGLYDAFSSNKTIAADQEYTKFSMTKEALKSDIAIFCKDAIREIIDDAFSSFSHNPLIYYRFFKMSGFFTVIRYPYERGDLKYTAQILLSKSQKERIERDSELPDISKSFPKEFSIPSFEDPLDQNSTSLADRCFALDTVQFGLSYDSKNQNEVSKSDEHRRAVENDFYRKLLDNRSPSNVFYVPIHVNGTAWIAIYRILRSESLLNDWYLNFELYNQYTLLIAEKVRLKAKEKFYKLVHIFLEKAAFASKETIEFIEECELMMNTLSAFFPYPVPFFDRNTNGRNLEDYLLYINESKFSLKLNYLWRNTVEHDKMEHQEEAGQVTLFCKQIGNTLKNLKLEEELRDASYSISHLLKNKLDEPIKQINKIKDDLDYLIDEAGLKLDKNIYSEHYKKFESLSNDLRKTLSILDLIPKSTYSNNGQNDYKAFLNNKSKYLLGPNSILDLMPEIEDAIARKIKRKDVDLILRQCSIFPFIHDDEGGVYAPTELVYNNCFVEAVINYSRILAIGPLIITSCYDQNNEIGICFKNKIESKETPDSEFVDVNRKEGFHGAIGYLNTVIKKVGLGIIKKQIIVENNEMYFQIGFFFKGLKIKTNG